MEGGNSDKDEPLQAKASRLYTLPALVQQNAEVRHRRRPAAQFCHPSPCESSPSYTPNTAFRPYKHHKNVSQARQICAAIGFSLSPLSPERKGWLPLPGSSMIWNVAYGVYSESA